MGPPAKEITSDYILVEIEKAEKELREKEAKLESQEEPVLSRLQRIDQETDDLLLANDLANWAKETHEKIDSDQCESLALLLCRHEKNSPVFQNILEQEYLPLHEYVRPTLLHQLRTALQEINFPSSQGCEQLFREHDERISDSTCQKIRDVCASYGKVRSAHYRLLKYVEGSISEEIDAVLLELCRPFVQRIRFHFVEPAKDRPTSTRIDRLPELLLSYIRENALEGGAWDVVIDIIAPVYDSGLPVNFLNELVRTVQWVLDQRGYFRHPLIAGNESKPELLCSAIESILEFDRFMRTITPRGTASRLLSLMDIFVAGDDEMLEWWIERERESAINLLFSDDLEVSLLSRTSPRAELFCSLIKSVLEKASLFSFSGPYVNRIAVPLCMRFLDAVEESMSHLKTVLMQRLIAPDDTLQKNFRQWIELINGIELSSKLLLEQSELARERSLSYHEDLLRFGESLEKVLTEAVADFATTFVEVVLMERGRLAIYLMQLPHLLSSSASDIDPLEKQGEFSSSLREPMRLLGLFLNCCDEASAFDIEMPHRKEDSVDRGSQRISDFVVGFLSDKILEIAVDVEGTTTSLHADGCALFARDVRKLFGERLLPNVTLRLLEIVSVMEMESKELLQIGNVLCGLAGAPPPLTEDMFSFDEKLYDEALSMIRAKEFVWMELSDLLGILNRRVDLAS